MASSNFFTALLTYPMMKMYFDGLERGRVGQKELPKDGPLQGAIASRVFVAIQSPPSQSGPTRISPKIFTPSMPYFGAPCMATIGTCSEPRLVTHPTALERGFWLPSIASIFWTLRCSSGRHFVLYNSRYEDPTRLLSSLGAL